MEKLYGLEIPESLEDACELNSLALIIYDMQVGILSQMKNGPEITKQVAKVLDTARNSGVRTFFMRHLSLPKEVAGVFQLRQAKAWQKVRSVDDVNPWFLRDSPGFQISPDLAPLPSEAILDKITMSAFEGTPLNIALRDCGIKSVAIVGVATEIGIEPTVRHAADLGYIPIVVQDACGAGHESAGERALASIKFMGDAFLTNTSDFCSILHQKSTNNS